MKKSAILLGILSTFFALHIKAQDTVSTADLLKRIEALEAEAKKPKEWDASIYGWVEPNTVSTAASLRIQENIN